MSDVCSQNVEIDIVRFTLVGLVASPEFQKCLTYIEILFKKFPKIFQKPYIRPMLEFDWVEYLIKAQKKFGGDFWHLEKPLVVFANKTYIGNDDDFMIFISKIFHVRLIRDYECLASKGLVDIYTKYLEIGRKFVFLTVSINYKIIGHMIFMLYSDLVPKTCKNFIRKCKRKHNGYRGTPMQRRMDGSWLQFGGFSLANNSRSCENYKVPHNRRGVLSMCNDGRHTHNRSQFFICLDTSSWMDYRYVAFGQLMQGEYVLRILENLKTNYEQPYPPNVVISNCGEITLDDTIDAKNVSRIEEFIEYRATTKIESILDVRDIPSVLLEMNYRKGLYNFDWDNEHHEMDNLPSTTVPTVTSISTFLSTISYRPQEEEMEMDECVDDLYADMYNLLNELLMNIPYSSDGNQTTDQIITDEYYSFGEA